MGRVQRVSQDRRDLIPGVFTVPRHSSVQEVRRVLSLLCACVRALCVCVCVCVCVHHACVCVCVHHTCVCVCVCVHLVYVCVYIVCVCACVCAHVCVRAARARALVDRQIFE